HTDGRLLAKRRLECASPCREFRGLQRFRSAYRDGRRALGHRQCTGYCGAGGVLMKRFAAIILALILSCPTQAIGKTSSHATARAPVPVTTPDIPHLPWTMESGVKVFPLTAEIVKREILPSTGMAPAKVLTLWGYNGTAPGPTIEVNEGDHVR